MKKWSGRTAAVLAIILIAAMVFVGCGKEEAGPAESPMDSPAVEEIVDAEPASIVIWTNFENEVDTLKEYGDMWAAETGNTVTVIHESIELQQVAQAVKSEDGPDAIYGIPNDQLANYVSAGLVQEVPADTYTLEDYADAAVQACYAEGKLYAVPIAVETNSLFYNTDKVEKAPESWEELIDVAKETGGIKFDATSVYYDLGFLRAYGSYIFKYQDGQYDVGDIGLGDENAVKAYTFIKGLAVDHGFFASDITFDLARSSFQNGETAFYIGGPWDIDGFQSAGTPFAVCPMPTLNGESFVTPVGTQVGFVSAKSDDLDATWDFFKYLMDNAALDLYDAGERIPANIEAQGQIPADEATKAFIAQIASGEPMPTVPELGQVWTPYTDNMKLMLQGEITPQEAAENIAAQVQEGIDLMNSGK